MRGKSITSFSESVQFRLLFLTYYFDDLLSYRIILNIELPRRNRLDVVIVCNTTQKPHHKDHVSRKDLQTQLGIQHPRYWIGNLGTYRRARQRMTPIVLGIY